MFLNAKIKWTLSICFVLSSVFLSQSVQATRYYVKPTGNDANSGLTEASAWQHIGRACTTMVAGDTTLVRSGNYRENNFAGPSSETRINVRFTNSGTLGNWITLKGYPGDVRPIIWGDTTPGVYPVWIDRDYILLDSLEIRKGHRGVVAAGTDYFTMRYCTVDSTGWSGVSNNNNGGFISLFNGLHDVMHVTIEYCEMFYNHDGGSVGGNTGGIYVYNCDTCVFRYNYLHHSGWGMRLKGCLNQGEGRDSTEHYRIYGNTIADNFVGGIDIGGQGGLTNVEVYNNVLYNSYTIGEAAIYVDGGQFGGDHHNTNIKIYNNTIDGEGYTGGIRTNFFSIDDLQVFNNIVYNYGHVCANYINAWGDACNGGCPTNVYEDYNMWYSPTYTTQYVHPNGVCYTLAQWQAGSFPGVLAGQGAHTWIANPLFVNAGTHDYHLQAGSPALTAGRGGAWPTYMGAFVPLGLTVTLTARPACLPPGGGTDTLTWTSTNADSVVIRNQATNQRLVGSGPANGTIQVTVTTATTYVATAYKAPNTATSQVTVTVGCSPTPTVTLTAYPSSFSAEGGTTTLTWTSTNADSVVIRDQHDRRIPGSGPTNSSTSDSLTSTTIYTATAYKMPNTSTAQVTVTVSLATDIDLSAPSAVRDFIVSNSTRGLVYQSITLRWTSPGDDADTGTASRYDLRYDTLLITNDTDFSRATPVVDMPSPRPAGSIDSKTLTNLDTLKVYYFALKTGDEVPNWSPLSNVVCSENWAGGRVATVSGIYSGYAVAPLTDGMIEPRNNAATWASDESALAHWVEVDFGVERPVNQVVVFWAWNNARSAWTVSQQYTIQRWNGSTYVDIVTVSNPNVKFFKTRPNESDSVAATITVFQTVNTQRIRIRQPANMGPSTYPVIMWLTEVNVEYDITPPPRVNDFKAGP